MLTKKYTILNLVLIVLCLLVVLLKHESKTDNYSNDEFASYIPYQINNWKGQDVTIDDRVSNILETNEIIHRTYTNDTMHDQQVLVSIVHYGDTKVDFHAPESCLGGLGQKVKKQEKEFRTDTIGMKKLNINELLSYSGEQGMVTYYFYKTGDSYDNSYIGTRMKIAYNKLFKNNSSASLIRLTVMVSSTVKNAQDLLDTFLGELIPVLIEKK